MLKNQLTVILFYRHNGQLSKKITEKDLVEYVGAILDTCEYGLDQEKHYELVSSKTDADGTISVDFSCSDEVLADIKSKKLNVKPYGASIYIDATSTSPLMSGVDRVLNEI